ncbi:membrane-bound lytic murein transglycosylase MltF [Spongiibacter taiwanensis]|uniref:membrane-bound lytic murein transglycosylase MltF n=1 Tax=Spongiibacter taiwanensis TaxID=1748242 RepID=UPI002034BFCC|nr:membrane-bound lytic murein transglycosylase MltF [Spongiibacter taiwanensis]USA42352.1 membrane-bound lytic murein transglycosylase MltF [Spongiibacter taiwanensis]
MKAIAFALGTTMLLLLTACEWGGGGRARTLEEIKQSGELRVLSRNAPTTYFFDGDGEPTGPEYDLAKAFADSLGVRLRIIVKDSVADILRGLERHKGDIAAAGLTETPNRQARFLFSNAIETVSEQVVCRREGKVATSAAGLAEVSLAVVTASSYEETLEQLQQTNPALSWTSRDGIGTETLLQDVWQGSLDCTVADSNIVAINRRFLPELLVMFDLGPAKPHGWALAKASTDLQQAVNDWMASETGVKARRRVHARYFNFIDTFDFVDTLALVERIDERLSKYDALFQQAAMQHAFDPVLVAAQSYQESHWDPKAKSPTGTRGIMMLTKRTATYLGVADRLDPEQAIPAGVAYLAEMRDSFSADIPEPDRTYLALAAYNVGRAHMHDAQALARKLNKDPHSWADMREVLPLLADRRHYKGLKYGYARGWEPVRYVQRIRNYNDIIAERLKSRAQTACSQPACASTSAGKPSPGTGHQAAGKLRNTLPPVS